MVFSRAWGFFSRAPSISFKFLFWLSGSTLFVLVPPALAFGGGVKMWLPEGVSTSAPLIDRVFYAVLAITGIAFVLVQGVLVFFLIKYRRRKGRAASYIHGNHWVEVVWTAIPAAILVALAFYSQRVWSYVRGTPPKADVQVEVIAQQFAWNIHYPGTDNVFGKTDPALVDEAGNPVGLDKNDPNAKDDIVTVNQLHIPVGKIVLIHLKSKDVIHSFFVPQFRMKLDAVPGITGHLWVSATKTGNYEIACAELCGNSHYRMRGFLVIDTPDGFQKWLEQTLAENT